MVEWSLREGTPFTFEFRIVRPDGSERMVHARGRVVADPQGTPVRMAGTVQDVTEWRGAEAALRQSEERFRRVFEEGPMGIAIVDPGLRFIRVNAAFGQMLGYFAGELRGQTLAEVTHPDDVDLDVAMARRAFAGEIPGGVCRPKTGLGALAESALFVAFPPHCAPRVIDGPVLSRIGTFVPIRTGRSPLLAARSVPVRRTLDFLSRRLRLAAEDLASSTRGPRFAGEGAAGWRCPRC